MKAVTAIEGKTQPVKQFGGAGTRSVGVPASCTRRRPGQGPRRAPPDPQSGQRCV